MTCIPPNSIHTPATDLGWVRSATGEVGKWEQLRGPSRCPFLGSAFIADEVTSEFLSLLQGWIARLKAFVSGWRNASAVSIRCWCFGITLSDSEVLVDPTAVSQTELKLVSDQELITLELNSRTGEITAISGTRKAIQQASDLLLGGLLKADTNDDSNTDEGRPSLPGRGEAWTDQEVRNRARPSSILAAIRGERERSSADLRLTDTEREREIRTVSPDGLSTRSRERELPIDVEPHDHMVSERVTVDHSPHPDARSGGDGNAVGPCPAVEESVADAEQLPGSVPASMVLTTAMREAHPPRSPGEGDFARGFFGNARSRTMSSVTENGSIRILPSVIQNPGKEPPVHQHETD